MPRKLTQEEFIAKARKVHGDYYRYDKTKYINNRTDIIITCEKHGDFSQISHSHLNGSGCKNCFNDKITKTTEQFILDARKVHGNRYNYDKVSYINSMKEILITCEKHGDFPQFPKCHLQGSNCPDCSYDEKLKSREQFIIDAREVYGNFYNYDKVDYINGYTEVTITCPIHGDFKKRPDYYLKGIKCKSCSYDKITKTTEQFILDARKVHGNRYNYDKVSYINNYTDVIITCLTHTDFFQQPLNHLQGNNCPDCTILNTPSYLHKKNLDQITNLYLVQLQSKSELFLKVGISNNIKKRIMNFARKGYTAIILKSKEGIGFDIVEFEKNFLKYYNKFKYTPKIEFQGYTECLDISLLKELPNDNWYIVN